MPETDFAEGLGRYFASREEQRQQDIADALPDLEQRMTEFLAARANDPGLGKFVARMIRETAVQGWATATPASVQIPKDSVIFYETLYTIRTSGESCTAWRIFDGRDRNDEEEAD